MWEFFILAVPGGWRITLDGEEIAFIESNSFYLKDVRFKKKGKKLVHFHQLAWPMISNQGFPYIWADNYKIEIINGDKPVWILKAENSEGSLEISTILEVVYENDRIYYKIKQYLKAKSDYQIIAERLNVSGNDFIALEFTDPHLMHVVGPACKFDGYWPGIYYPGQGCDASIWEKRWDSFIFENPLGVYKVWKHNHHYYSGWRHVAKGGLFAALGYDEGNVASRFTGGEDCTISVCWWGYDTHYNVLLKCDEVLERPFGRAVIKAGQGFDVEYELFCLDDEESKHILSNLSFDEYNEDNLKNLDRPVICGGINKFDKKLELDDMNSFVWMNSGKGATWDKSVGYDDSFSLKLSSDGDEIPVWGNRVGQEMFMKPIESGKSYRLLAYVKAREITGEGVKIGVSFGVPRWPGIYGVLLPFQTYWSEAINGDSDWIKIEVTTPPAPPDTISAHITMELNGKGEAWLDNLLFELI